MCRLQWQSARGQGGGILGAGSAFLQQTTSWAALEPILGIGGTAATAALLVRTRGMVVRPAMALVVPTLWVFIGRGGVVLPFYLAPILPFLALYVVIVVWAALIALCGSSTWSADEFDTSSRCAGGAVR